MGGVEACVALEEAWETCEACEGLEESWESWESWEAMRRTYPDLASI